MQSARTAAGPDEVGDGAARSVDLAGLGRHVARVIGDDASAAKAKAEALADAVRSLLSAGLAVRVRAAANCKAGWALHAEWTGRRFPRFDRGSRLANHGRPRAGRARVLRARKPDTGVTGGTYA